MIALDGRLVTRYGFSDPFLAPYMQVPKASYSIVTRLHLADERLFVVPSLSWPTAYLLGTWTRLGTGEGCYCRRGRAESMSEGSLPTDPKFGLVLICPCAARSVDGITSCSTVPLLSPISLRPISPFCLILRHAV